MGELPCPACERPNPTGFRFCGACGASLEDERSRSSFLARPDVSALLGGAAGPLADLAPADLARLDPPTPPESGDVAARLAAAIHQVAGSEDRGGTVIEILPVYLKDGEIWWLRPTAGTSLQVDRDGSAHPGDAVVSALAGYGVHPVAVHSTSWRFERGRLVVTYLAVLDVSAPKVQGFHAAEVRRRDLARGSAFEPPPTIEIEHVVEHALRHLAWLGRDDPLIKDLLHRGWFRALEAYEPEPFRSLTDAASPGDR